VAQPTYRRRWFLNATHSATPIETASATQTPGLVVIDGALILRVLGDLLQRGLAFRNFRKWWNEDIAGRKHF
jgi:hypothetical protein